MRPLLQSNATPRAIDSSGVWAQGDLRPPHSSPPPIPPPSAESATRKEGPLRGALSSPSPRLGDTESWSFCGAPLPRASYCSAALGSVGGILRSRGGPSEKRCGGSGFSGLRRAPAALVSFSDSRRQRGRKPATYDFHPPGPGTPHLKELVVRASRPAALPTPSYNPHLESPCGARSAWKCPRDVLGPIVNPEI